MYTPIGGWSLTPEQIYIGLTRLFYPFLCGLLIFRLGRFISVKGGFWWCSLILRSKKICNFLGELPYPLYITHFPLIYMLFNWKYSNPDAPLYAHVMISAGVFVLAILIACAALKLYDIPVRTWLKEHWLKRRQN